MTAVEIVSLITQRFGAQLTGTFAQDKHPRIHISVEHWKSLAHFLRHNDSLSFDWLANLSAIDYVADNAACMVYDLYSFDRKHSFAVKVFAPRMHPIFPSTTDLWPAANWHEREAFDLFGFGFEGHPDLRRILMADDWEGHPLLKDYVFPRSYQGIPGSVELDWHQQSG